MTTRTVTDCDRCKAREVPTCRICVPVGTRAGVDGVETRYREFDLCIKCAGPMLNGLLEEYIEPKEGNSFIHKHLIGPQACSIAYGPKVDILGENKGYSPGYHEKENP